MSQKHPKLRLCKWSWVKTHKYSCGKCYEDVTLGATRLVSRQGVEVRWVIRVTEDLWEHVTFMVRNDWWVAMSQVCCGGKSIQGGGNICVQLLYQRLSWKFKSGSGGRQQRTEGIRKFHYGHRYKPFSSPKLSIIKPLSFPLQVSFPFLFPNRSRSHLKRSEVWWSALEPPHKAGARSGRVVLTMLWILR